MSQVYFDPVTDLYGCRIHLLKSLRQEVSFVIFFVSACFVLLSAKTLKSASPHLFVTWRKTCLWVVQHMFKAALIYFLAVLRVAENVIGL